MKFMNAHWTVQMTLLLLDYSKIAIDFTPWIPWLQNRVSILITLEGTLDFTNGVCLFNIVMSYIIFLVSHYNTILMTCALF